MMDANTMLQQLGDPGRFTWTLTVVLCISYFPVTFNHLAMAIYGATPPYRCEVPDGRWLNQSLPPKSSSDSLSQCYAYVNYTRTPPDNATVSCPDGWHFTLKDGESTIVNEWSLVCDKRWMPYIASSVYFIGVMLGGLVFGTISDMYGRRPVLVVTSLCYLGLGIVVHFVENFVVFMLLRAFIGVLMQGLQLCTYVFAVEMLGTQTNRAYFAGMFETSWALGVMTLAGIAYWLKDWRWIQLAITLPTVIGCIYVWFLPESIRWLVLKKRYRDAVKVMQRAAKFNGVTLPDDLEQRAKKAELNQEEDVRVYGIWDMFKTPKLRKRSLVMFYVWLATSFGYYGLSLNASKLAGDKYLNFFISGAIELPAYLSGMWIFSRIGRKKPLVVYFLIGGISCILAGAIPNETSSGKDISWLPTTLAWVGKFSMAGCWSVLFLYSSEVFPTSIRNVGVGASAFWARVGGILAPLINLLGDYYESWVPILIFGIASLIGAGLTLLLPETQNRSLPDTIEEVENSVGSEIEDVDGTPNNTYGSFNNQGFSAEEDDPIKTKLGTKL